MQVGGAAVRQRGQDACHPLQGFALPSELRFAEVRTFLEQYGWTLDRISGSHHIFVKEGQANVSVPVRRNRVKWVYIRKIEKTVGEPFRPERG